MKPVISRLGRIDFIQIDPKKLPGKQIGVMLRHDMTLNELVSLLELASRSLKLRHEKENQENVREIPSHKT